MRRARIIICTCRICLACAVFLLLSASPLFAEGLTQLQEIDIPKGFEAPKDEKLNVDITVGAGYNTNSQIIGLFSYKISKPFKKYPNLQQHVYSASPVYPYTHGLSFGPIEYPGYNINPFYPWPISLSTTRSLGFQAQPGQRWNDYYFEYTEPGLTDLDMTGYAKPYWFRRDFFVRNQSEYVVQRLGALLEAKRQITSNLSVEFSYRHESTRILDLAPDVPATIENQAGVHNLAMWRAELVYKNLDTYLYHRNGYYVIAAAILAGIPAGGDVNFWRFRAGATWFQQLWEFPRGTPNVVELRGLLGLTGPAFGDDEVAFYERFYAGGFGTVRGYAFRSIGPLENGIPVGGDMLTVGSVEYGFHVLDPYLRPFLFVDTGAVTRRRTFGFWNQMRGSLGVGIDLYNAGGVYPVEFDYIFYHFNTQPNDIPSMFSFAVMISF